MTQFADFAVAPLTPAVGGLVSGLDLARPLSDRTIANLRAAVAERHVLFFENQLLDPAAQRDFASRFGKLHVHPVYPTWRACQRSRDRHARGLRCPTTTTGTPT